MTPSPLHSPPVQGPSGPSWVGILLFWALLASGCQAPPSGGVDGEALADLELRLAERFTPGLHSLMTELQHRHANLWFAGEAGNWPLADYFLHEIEELIEDMEEMHPVYREVPVAELLGEMTLPAVEAMEEAVERGDRAAFEAGFDQFTTACNACHIASDRDALVVVRPTAPPLTNLRYLPRP